MLSLEPRPLQESEPAFFERFVFQRLEADRKTADQARLDLLPGGIDAVLERPWLGDLRELRFDRDAIFASPSRATTWPTGWSLPMVMQQRHGQRERGTQRLDDVADAIHTGACSHAFDDSLFRIQRFDR